MGEILEGQLRPLKEAAKVELDAYLADGEYNALQVIDRNAAVAEGKEKLETAAKNLEDIATRVIRGEFGNGADRKAALEKAGFNYDEVQAKVNELLSGAKETASNALKSVDEIAKEVIRGDWGNGAERKEALEKAGYKFEEIQAKVNELLK